MVLEINKDRKNYLQFLVNIPPEWSHYDVLCEIDASRETATVGAASMAETTTINDTTEPIRRYPVTMAIEGRSRPTDNATKSMTSEPTSINGTVGVLCPVRHGNKCFFPVIGEKASYNGGMEICDRYGGHLANIYNQTHMDDVMNYIREHGWRGTSTYWMRFRLGMKFDPQNGTLSLRDGSDASDDLQWFAHYPDTGESYTSHTTMALEVNKDRRSDRQFLINIPPAWLYDDVLCEIETSEGTNTGSATSLAVTTAIPDITEPVRGFPVTMTIEESSGPADNSTKSITSQLTSLSITTRDPCPVRYEVGCFFAVLERKVNLTEGEKICERFGGNLANIYSETHMDAVMNYIRREFDTGEFERLRLGMAYDPQTGKLYFRDGSEVPADLRWYLGQPLDNDTSMVLGVSWLPFFKVQYLDNRSPEALFYILCETGVSEETATRGATSMAETAKIHDTTAGVLCPVRHGNKCFFPVIREDVSYNDGMEICDRYGAHLANIYNQTHMNDVMNYIRKHRWRWSSRNMMYFRLGMKFDPLNGKLSLRDGSDASDDLRWWPGYLTVGRSYSSYTTMILNVNKDWMTDQQFLSNAKPEWLYNDVLCEIESSEETATGGAAAMIETTAINYLTEPIRGFPVTTQESSGPADDTT